MSTPVQSAKTNGYEQQEKNRFRLWKFFLGHTLWDVNIGIMDSDMNNNKQTSVEYWIEKLQKVGNISRYNDAWDQYIGKKVEVKGKIGTYLAKHIEIPLHYILLDGDDEPKLFHTFEWKLDYKIQGATQ